MWMPAAVRRRILRYLFENGVLVVSDNQSGTHEELDCLNIYAFQIGRSLTNKGFCKKQYAWSHAYFTLNDKGIDYLRNYFGLPANAAPATLAPRQAELLEKGREGGRFGGRPRGRGGRNFGGRPEGRGNFRRGGRRPQGEGAEAAEAPAEAAQSE
ncbi:Plectin/S10 domain containing protein [Tritrichomonas foetus]|uniref:Plectin/S10 domain containing protein n=1 Tax=Tritrichomonas foetus TaxID=1144522 RepID=A0A1J4K5D7_9EUKA|nr:Plectin/S10 domain containing protein [Tritrichomonas foetus]|eukprot:OHT06607.1 Plectin/S10 domain containing protein [Tritrichomonas foetus]